MIRNFLLFLVLIYPDTIGITIRYSMISFTLTFYAFWFTRIQLAIVTQTSVPMSTYLVAFVVSEFVNTPSDPNLSPTVQFGIWARPSFAGQTEYVYTV